MSSPKSVRKEMQLPNVAGTTPAATDIPTEFISDYAQDAEKIWRDRRTPTQADVTRIFDEVKAIEHLQAIAQEDPGRRGKEAKRELSHRRWRLAFTLSGFFPIPLPDGRIVTSGRKDGNFSLIFERRK